MTINFSKLDNAIEKMGGKLVSKTIELSGEEETLLIKSQLKKGIEIEHYDFVSTETIAGMLSYKGEHCFLYIDEPKRYEDVLIQKPAINAQRFHLVKECLKLQDMHNQGFSGRYKLINNPEGHFPCYPLDPKTGKNNKNKTIYSQLMACKQCLHKLSYKGYKLEKNRYNRKNDNIWKNFNIEEFCNYYQPFFFEKKLYNANNQKNVNSIEKCREREEALQRANFTCQDNTCNAELPDHPEILHLYKKKILCTACFVIQTGNEKHKLKFSTQMIIMSRRKKH